MSDVARDRSSPFPNLFIVGAPKCGTTAWADYLRTHPDIHFPAVKDQCYFAHDLPNFRLTKTEDDYQTLFADRGTATIVGEASAMYLFSREAAEAIRAHNPAAKILIFLRDQESYLPSLHNQFLREFAEEIEDFETVWRMSDDRPSDTIPSTCLEPRTLDYRAMGRFHEQVGRFVRVFPAEQIMVVDYRAWVAEPRSAYLAVLDFLGLEDDGRTEFPRVNPGTTFRARGLTRLAFHPPAPLRRAARAFKRVTGPIGRWLHATTLGAARGLARTGYRDTLARELRAEIQDHYADDWAKLDRLLRAEGVRHLRAPPLDRTPQ